MAKHINKDLDKIKEFLIMLDLERKQRDNELTQDGFITLLNLREKLKNFKVSNAIKILDQLRGENDE